MPPSTNTNPQLLLCADCGGSKTSLVLSSAHTGQILTRIQGGPSNFSYLGLHDFVQVIQETVGRGLEDPNVRAYLQFGDEVKEVKNGLIKAAWIAISGVDTKSDELLVREAISKYLSVPLESPLLQITNDTHLLAAPLLSLSPSSNTNINSCLAVVAGTGSCIVSFRNIQGRIVEQARTGGYGWILGDEGSGFHVGRETVRALCTKDDVDLLTASLPSTTTTTTPTPTPTYDLKSLILSYFGLPPTASSSQIFKELYASDPNPTLASHQVSTSTPSTTNTNAHLLLERQQRLSRLTPVVFKAAFGPSPSSSTSFTPHPLAIQILRSCLSELVSKILLLLSPKAEGLYISPFQSLLCLGGSLVKQTPYRNLLVEMLKEQGCEFADVVFVDEVEKVGVEALFKLVNDIEEVK